MLSASKTSLTVAAALVALASAPASGQTANANPQVAGVAEMLAFRHVGPVGNRISAVTGIPGDINTYLVGAASGGIWKSENSGTAWRPVFDDFEVQAIGALAVAPSDPDIVWAGTGERSIRSNVSHGVGVFKSTDQGENWTFMGLPETGRISRIVIHPTNPDVVWVGALGHLYGPQEERGVFKTTDGGQSWNRVLFVDDLTGVSDLWIRPDNPDVLIAGMWTMHIRTWGRWSGGPNDGLYMSQDGGESWDRLTGNGLPTGTTGKIAISGSAADPDRVYALIETNINAEFEAFEEHEGVLWRSDDGGTSWTMVNADHSLIQRPNYYTNVYAMPDNADEVHFMAVGHTMSRDGGLTTTRSGAGAGGDNHDMWADPTMPDRIIVGHDGGISISTDRGRNWSRPLLPVAQVYHVTTDNAVPYNLYGNRQDGPSTRGPSRTTYGGSIPIGEWRSIGGCESGWSVPDTVNNVAWSGCYEGILDIHDLETRNSRTVSVWPDNPEGWNAGPLRYRFQWTFPISLSPHDPSVVYVGSQHVHRTTNGGQSFQVISPDLSTGRDSLLMRTGGLTPDDVSPTFGAVVFAIAESPLTRGEIWAGTNDGQLHISRDNGANWIDLTAALPGLTELSTISSIEPSRHTRGKAYVAVDGHQVNDFSPQLLVTEDWGATWATITDGIPEHPLSFTHVLREDPHVAGLLYAGTGNGLYVSVDDGTNWTRFNGNMPAAPVHWLEIQPHYNDLVIATYGRGFWIADDITPLQDLARRGGTLTEAVTMFPARDTYRMLRTESPFSQPGDAADGTNPNGGASITYALRGSAQQVTVEIVDAGGEVIAEVPGTSGAAGLHRVHWNLRHFSSQGARVLTAPIGHEHFEMGPQGRGVPDGGRVSPMAVPGRYTVRLTVDGARYETPLTLLQDPASTATMADMQAQLDMTLELRAEQNRVGELITQIEVERVRLMERRAALSDTDANATAIDTRLQALIDIEMELYDLRIGSGQDTLRWPRQLFAKIASLSGYISGSDDRPTDQAREVHQVYKDRLARIEAALRALTPIAQELPAAEVEVNRAPVAGR